MAISPKTLTRRAAAAATLVLLAGSAGAQAPSGIAGVVAPGVEPELVQEGFVFTEGPVAAPDGGLYFSDIRPNRIYRLDPSGKIDLVREQTNGANGLAVTAEGDLLAAEGGGKRISRRSRDGTVTTVTEGIEGKPFLAPNDLIIDAKGGIYITDQVYITTVTGVQVFDAEGKYLGTIKVARQPANAAFGGPDKKVLYITAREGLYRMPTLAQGADRVGK
jgi:gluconolactonase